MSNFKAEGQKKGRRITYNFSCQWLDESNCISSATPATAFGMNCVEIITNSSFKLSNFFGIFLAFVMLFKNGKLGFQMCYVQLGLSWITVAIIILVEHE